VVTSCTKCVPWFIRLNVPKKESQIDIVLVMVDFNINVY
jgi:hypothetical protein